MTVRELLMEIILIKNYLFPYILKPLNTNPKKWSNTLKQFVGNLPTNCLSVFDHFVKLALKGLTLPIDVYSARNVRKNFVPTIKLLSYLVRNNMETYYPCTWLSFVNQKNEKIRNWNLLMKIISTVHLLLFYFTLDTKIWKNIFSSYESQKKFSEYAHN